MLCCGRYRRSESWDPLIIGGNAGCVTDDHLGSVYILYEAVDCELGCVQGLTTLVGKALSLMQEKLYDVRSRMELSLVSFDVKEAHNGVNRDVVFRRLIARQVPETLVTWIEAFCTDRLQAIRLISSLGLRRLCHCRDIAKRAPPFPSSFLSN